jgi:hypothetical protein
MKRALPVPDVRRGGDPAASSFSGAPCRARGFSQPCSRSARCQTWTPSWREQVRGHWPSRSRSASSLPRAASRCARPPGSNRRVASAESGLPAQAGGGGTCTSNRRRWGRGAARVRRPRDRYSASALPNAMRRPRSLRTSLNPSRFRIAVLHAGVPLRLATGGHRRVATSQNDSIAGWRRPARLVRLEGAVMGTVVYLIAFGVILVVLAFSAFPVPGSRDFRDRVIVKHALLDHRRRPPTALLEVNAPRLEWPPGLVGLERSGPLTSRPLRGDSVGLRDSYDSRTSSWARASS